VSYALGSANKDLPTFINIGRPSSRAVGLAAIWAQSVAATPFQSGENAHSESVPPKGLRRRRAGKQMEALQDLNKKFREVTPSIPISKAPCAVV